MFAIRAMSEADANAVAGWRYPGEYAFCEGHGAAFLDAGLRFAAERFGARRLTLAVVAAFNERAITIYEPAGFAATERYRHHTNGADHDFVAMARGPLP